MNGKLEIPKVNQGQRCVLFAEIATGILLTIEGERYLGQGEFYLVFNSEEAAANFALDYAAKNPKVECIIGDENGNHLRFVRKKP